MELHVNYARELEVHYRDLVNWCVDEFDCHFRDLQVDKLLDAPTRDLFYDLLNHLRELAFLAPVPVAREAEKRVQELETQYALLF